MIDRLAENELDIDIDRLTETCNLAMPVKGHSALLESLSHTLPGRAFQVAVDRGGWYRVGGVVTSDGERVSDNLVEWAERESGGDVTKLIDKYADARYFATRLNGQMHYLVASTGERACDFVQIEVEEVEEVLDRALIEPDWSPDNLEEFVDPLDYPRLAPEPVAKARYMFRRSTAVAPYVQKLTANSETRTPIQRFFEDWERSSASEAGPLCRHWVLSLREYTDHYGEPAMSAKPITTFCGDLPGMDPERIERGAKLANLIHDFDRMVGYPGAWYFFMLTHPRVPHQIAEAIHADLVGAYDYLPARDLKVLKDWSADPYGL